MKVIDVKNYGMFWIRMTVRLLSVIAAWFTTDWFNLTYGIYAYFFSSIVLDIVFFKLLRLKESNFKSPGYFKHKFQSSPGHYDRYVGAVINAKAVTFVLAHGVFLAPYFKAPIEIVNGLFALCLIVIVFRYSFKFGYHQLKIVNNEEAKFFQREHVSTSGEYGRIGDGLPGWRMGIYTGDEHHRG